MSLMWSLNPEMGVTLIRMAFPRFSPVRVVGAYAESVSPFWSTTHAPVRARS